jgi:hypothetical protein
VLYKIIKQVYSINIRRYEMNLMFMGIEECEMVCEFCNKKEIGRAFVFRNMETLDYVRYGSQCARKALGFSSNAKLGKKIRQDIEARFQEECNKARRNGDFMNGIKIAGAEKQKSLDLIRSVGL